MSSSTGCGQGGIIGAAALAGAGAFGFSSAEFEYRVSPELRR